MPDSPEQLGSEPESTQAAPHHATAWRGAGLVLLTGFTALSASALVWQVVWPQAISIWGITIDRLSAMLTLLVAAIGAITYRYSIRYLHGDPHQGRFLRNLTLTICCAYALMLSTNLLLLFVSWTLTGLGLHALLLHNGHRLEARKSARKKFLISRLGDLALIAAIVLIWQNWHTLDLHELVRATATGAAPDAVLPVSLLIVLAALTKSAQFPFHSWLPETMEAPTPVSALMHAGIINAGGALLLRFAPILNGVPSALLILVIIGTLTAALGTVAMWAQVKVKRTLAWSTVAQMGFMMLQCGLGAFAPATLHLFAHGCYKAWSFLPSGELPSVAPVSRPLTPATALLLTGIGIVAALPAMMVASLVVGFSPLHSPGEMALAGILALATGQLWVACFKTAGASAALRTSLAAVLTLIGALLAFTLYKGSVVLLAPVLQSAAAPTAGSGSVAWIAAAIPVVTFALLSVLYALLPTMGRSTAGRALHIHALHGFYFGAMADRVVATVWPDRNNTLNSRDMTHA